MEEKKYIKSPINYIGGKYKLLNKIIPLFPKDIHTFVDLFGGAFNVGINVDADCIIYNDIINYITELLDYWNKTDLSEINAYIDSVIKENNLSSTNLDGFLSFREKYNKEKDIRDLFILICYSFNYQIRFNNKQQYNSSFGKERSTMNNYIRNNLNLFVEKLHSGNYIFSNKNFIDFDYSNLTEEDFVYCDCPYSIATAVYQDGKRGFNGWSKEDDKRLFDILDKLNEKGVRFALSNVFENKDLRNDELIEWSKKYKVYHLNFSYSGSNYQRKKGKSDEVLIVNY